MKISIPSLFRILLVALPLTVAAAEQEVIYWNSDAGKVLRARIAPDEDYWQLIPWFTNQENQTYCGVASAGKWGQIYLCWLENISVLFSSMPHSSKE